MKSKQLKEFTESGVLPENSSYCRKCMQIKPKESFSKTTTPDIDKTNCMSLCKKCVDELYEKILVSENGSIQKTILKLCKLLNVIYYEPAIESSLKHIETKQSDPNKVFGLYRAKTLVLLRDNVSDLNVDLTYQDNPIVNSVEKNILQDDEFKEARDLKAFWQTSDKSDLEFLENEFANFKKTNKADTHAEKILLKQVCYKLLDMDKDRKAGKSTDASLKQLMSIMEKMLISPNTVNAANSGENLDTFGSWIADIEKNEPAQWLEGDGKELYKDVEDVEGYFQKYFVRPLRNFILQAKDWNIDDEELGEEIDIFKEPSDGEESNEEPIQLPE